MAGNWKIWTSVIRSVAAALTIGAAGLVAPGNAFAGPPFLTDDPEPVDYHHGEFYVFSQETQVNGGRDGVLPAIEANYGILPNTMIHVILPLRSITTADGETQQGYGDTEFGVKYRFVEDDPNGLRPAIGTFPLVVTPTGNKNKGLGSGETEFFLPLWIQKSFGRWVTYGGGGYWHNPGEGNKNYWFYGWLLQRQVTDKLALGGELFHQTKDTEDGPDTSGYNLGGVYDFTENHHLLFSAGRGIRHASETNTFSYYLGYQLTY
jgi:hypothetical protein